MVLVVLIILGVFMLWLLSLKYADKIGKFVSEKIINKIKNIFK